MMAIGDDLFIVRSRVAKALGIRNNDSVQVEFTEIGEVVTIPNVKISDQISSDVLIHDVISLRLAKSIIMDADGEKIKFHSGKVLDNPPQRMWAGMRMVIKQGHASLYFDGANQSNPQGPAGYGFSIVQEEPSKASLIKGYGYAGLGKSNNEMEYQGLLEGLIWATRLDLTRLSVYGDSELVIRQMTGQYKVREPRLKDLHSKVKALLSENSDLVVEFHHIPRKDNKVADLLAQMAIDTRMNVTSCTWPNINRLMSDD
jgi:ribonuclease HI